MTDPLRYGVVGTGMMGVEHINNLLALQGAEISAIADPHGPSRDAAAAALEAGGVGAVPCFEDHRELLQSASCDVIVVASPNHTHIDVLRDALRTEVHVLVEKPLCTTVEDCAEVASLAAERAAVTAVGLEYRYMPSTSRFIEEVHGGTIGQLRMLAIREHRFPFLRKVDDWNRFSANTGGTLVEKCCHFFDLMRVAIGAEPVRVMASGAQDVNHLDEVYDGGVPDILDNAFVIVDFEGGARAMLDLCMFAEATTSSEELVAVGDRGKIEALLPSGTIRVGRRGEHFYGAVEEHSVTDDRIGYEGFHHGASYLEHVDVMDAIRTGRRPTVGVDDGLRSVAMGVAAHRSIDEGRPVAMEEVLSA